MAAAGFTQPMGPTETVRIKRFFYQHILDTNTNVTRCLVGPLVYARKDYEVCLFEPKPCVSVPSRCYCRILNPCERDAEGQPIVEPTGQVRLRMGDAEIRFDGNPFPLYPGEECQEEGGETILKLQDIPVNKGYHVRCIRDFKDESGALVKAGSSWMERGPKTYIPRVEVTVERVVEGHIIKPNTALQLRAQTAYVDSSGAPRVAGETWLVRTPGAYLPAVEEEVLGVVHGVVLTPKRALHLRAKYTFTDVYGVSRRAGEMWMVTNKDASVHIVDVSEEKVQCVDAVTLTSQQYCVILNPVDETGKNRYGEIRTRCGECTFFLHPDEELRDGVQDVLVAGMDEALLLKAVDDFQDGDVRREAGSMWMIYGPVRYVPTNDVQVMEHRRMITLDKNEGVYVKDTTTGEVRSVIGQPYMLKANEVLWNKQLTTQVEQLLECPEGSQTTSEKPVCFKSTREKHKVVRFNVQHNAAIQIYDYRTRESRIVLGPSLVMLAPHEDFTVLTLSGGKPKVPDTIQSLQLFLGPRFSSDTIVVETSDHARLRLHMSYNWHFDVDRASPDSRIFSVPDFIGDCCKTIASQVRGAVAGEDFDSFHRNSAEIIRAAVFGTDDAGNIRKELYFTANRFVVTNIDIQSVEPTDEKTRDSLQKSVQLAIEITTKSQEASARHGNERKDQEAKGQLERQKLHDQIEVEKARTNWLKLQAESESMQAKGQSVAEATAKAEALLIEVKSELHQAQLRAQAYRISADSELKKLQQRQKLEQEYTRRQFEMEVDKARQLADAEADKVKRMVDAIGRETLVSIARAGPETQAKLLGSLGLKGYLITDGNSPVNLFNTAQGIIGGGKDMTH